MSEQTNSEIIDGWYDAGPEHCENELARFQGRNRNNRPVMGVAKPGESAARLAQRLWRNRYKRASIFIGTRRVGGVDVVDGRRIWWGEAE